MKKVSFIANLFFMSKSYLIKNVQLINEGEITSSELLIKNGRIEKIASEINVPYAVTEIDGQGKHLMPGIIDDQVHFREPGLTHKAEIYTEARAAVAGGTTSFMEMPNVKPPTITQQKLTEKYAIGANRSIANYSFFMGVTNDNYDEVMRTNAKDVCGLKIFMGSSTGNMLVDNQMALQKIFANAHMLIATHCEDENTVKRNTQKAIDQFGEDIPFDQHPIIRDVEACYLSSSLAIEMAKRYNTRLHILHISTEKEIELFNNLFPLKNKRITAEACVHHLWFDADQYQTMGSKIKCNPAIKEKSNKEAILKALLEDKIDIIATDHAPHTIDEKANKYLSAPSGLPLVQHSLNVMLNMHHQGKITLEKLVEKMCHAPAECFKVKERGYLREGYHADLVLVDINETHTVTKENVLSKCGWSPFEGEQMYGKVEKTWVSGHLAYNNGKFDETKKGERLLFNHN